MFWWLLLRKERSPLTSGDIPDKCYFVLQGCVRQYAVDENGNENTYNFFTEEQSVTIFNQHTTDQTSPIHSAVWKTVRLL